jgi:hypothetical protein
MDMIHGIQRNGLFCFCDVKCGLYNVDFCLLFGHLKFGLLRLTPHIFCK